MAKIKTDDFKNLPLEKWNATTYRAYMKALNEMYFDLPYVAKNVQMENACISRMQKEYGNELVKDFITACYKEYKPRPLYPSLNFGFIYSHMKDYMLPRVLQAHKLKKQAQARTQQLTDDEMDAWI
jgi:hypothetical protein